MKSVGCRSARANWDCSLRMLLAGLAGCGAVAYGDIPAGLVGGLSNDSSAYAVFFDYPSGAVTPVNGLPGNSDLYAVAMNSAGVGLVGGEASDVYGFAAFVFPDGSFANTSISFLNYAQISGVAINEGGLGLIGGYNNSVGYAQFVSLGSDYNSLDLEANHLDSVGLNDSGVGLVGGEGLSDAAYAAYVYPSGDVLPLTLPSDGRGDIGAVAVNDFGNGIIGGYSNDPSVEGGYAAFVTPGGEVNQLRPLSTINSVEGVAINSAGNGLIGGYDDSGNAYAGYAAPDGSLTAVFSSLFLGEINSVALNDSGIGLVGGQNGSNLYAALVQPGGESFTLLFPNSAPPGYIQSVALNDAGVGVIGGQINSSAYAAIVAPNGQLTQLALSSGYQISSVALALQTVPLSVGPYSGAIHAQLAAAAALESRFIQRNGVWTSPAKSAQSEMGLAYNEYDPSGSEMDFALNSGSASTPKETAPKNSFWLQPFGDWVHLKSQGAIPSLDNEVAGVLLGYERQGDRCCGGIALGYAFDYIHYSGGLGHTKIQEELVSLYGSYATDDFWFDGAIWGGLYQFTNERHTFSQITSIGKKYGWIFSPHLEIASPQKIDEEGRYWAEPFALVDWVNNWQRHYTEAGSSGLNLQVPGIYNSLLQSEAGFRFYERFTFGWGDFRLEEKVSYVNQAPFSVHSASASFVGSAAAFPIAVASSRNQNLGSIQIFGSFVPANRAYPYGGFEAQATANGSYQSYFATVFGGLDF